MHQAQAGNLHERSWMKGNREGWGLWQNGELLAAG